MNTERESAALATQPAASAEPVNRQAIADHFAFLEGVVNEHNYRRIVDVACALAVRKADDVRDAERYRLLRRGQKWSVIDGTGDTLRADALDAAIDVAKTPTPEGDAVQEFIDATDALLESQERKTWTSGYAKEMTAGERMAVAARWRKARAALVGQHDGMRWPSDFPMKHEGDGK